MGDSGTPKVQCRGRIEAEKLEGILTRIKNGEAVKSVLRAGSIVYVHFGGD